ncbi:MAG: type II toxin-antitoxin system HicA family toxin [Rhodanobacteraceae bacterium]|jgi:predicted RNA binding protein YcfA (HicA-like mRNA interferase family)|nr:type II toxin-antitoxin system HicA family toxin [Rhodanobacteraceae bacterium]MBL0041264.1 type II toxin-antitoxin system HicA family toxin [Xanthomonadales bacterium]MBP6079279.1 type II toxin-antitoxin system HicA family toxin [Xanthomonadales bacterium]MBP7622873.1 type II toxin-antitoxin system HicA family toxin [Xanthomonadales bacterium]
MKLPRNLDADDLIKALSRIGYVVVRQTGSHVRLHCSGPVHAITIPNHRPLRVGTLAAILQDVEIAFGMERATLVATLFD